MYKMTIDLPEQHKGAEIQIAGLGTYENGKTYTIDSEEHDNFRRYHGRVVPTRNEADEIVGSEFELGPTLLQANIYGVKVETAKETPEEKKAREAAEKAEAEARKEQEEVRVAFAKEQEYDLDVLSDAEYDSWVFDPESSAGQDADAKLVAAKAEKDGEN